jgi:hypothetical protein
MDDELNKNLITLFKIFKNRPYHLTKYLIDNNALNKEFIKKVRESEKLNNITNNKLDSEVYFTNISQMEDFYSSILDEVKKLTDGKSSDVIEEELNNKLNDLIKNEKYEEAAQLRDYMIFNKIKKK